MQAHYNSLVPFAKAGQVQVFSTRRKAGFTLLELLVVAAIISILASLLLPTLVHSKIKAQGTRCENNNKQLILAWIMYTGDNGDKLVYNLGGSADRQTLAQRNAPNWVNNIMDWNLSPDNTNVTFTGSSLLGPDTANVPEIFHCPSDRVLSEQQKEAGWTSRVRSVSMNAMVGNPGDLLQGKVNVNNPYYVQFLKGSDIRNPADIFVFLDEHPDSINDGYFLGPSASSYYTLEWDDLPGSYHDGGTSISFADGHAEMHRWADPDTLKPNVAFGAPLPFYPAKGEHTDTEWLVWHRSVAQ